MTNLVAPEMLRGQEIVDAPLIFIVLVAATADATVKVEEPEIVVPAAIVNVLQFPPADRVGLKPTGVPPTKVPIAAIVTVEVEVGLTPVLQFVPNSQSPVIPFHEIACACKMLVPLLIKIIIKITSNRNLCNKFFINKDLKMLRVNRKLSAEM